jgi:hypothetical protein
MAGGRYPTHSCRWRLAAIGHSGRSPGGYPLTALSQWDVATADGLWNDQVQRGRADAVTRVATARRALEQNLWNFSTHAWKATYS